MTRLKELVIATQNKGKVVEIAKAFEGLPVKLMSLSEFDDIPEPIESGETFRENALLKAHYYAKITGKACLADDSGLEVDALAGAPGVYSARYAGENTTDALNNEKLIRELNDVSYQNRTARFCCVLAFVDTDGAEIIARGVCEGMILTEARGTGGFGYDPLFYISDKKLTMAELTVAEKNLISHRGAALKAMTPKLARYMVR